MGVLPTRSGFPRPDFEEVLARVRQDAASRMGPYGYDVTLSIGLLPSLLYPLSTGEHNNNGHIDHMMDEAFIQTMTGERLDKKAAEFGMSRFPADFAEGEVQITGAVGAVLPKGAILSYGDGARYRTKEAVAIGADETGIVIVRALDPGYSGNRASGDLLALQKAVAGLDPTAVAVTVVGGLDAEQDGAPYDPSPGFLRGRVWYRMRNPPRGGSDGDWLGWTNDVPGVTRAWVSPYGQGGGTVLIYIMMDNNPGGIPIGIDNMLSVEPTGDYLRVVTALQSEGPALTTPIVTTAAPEPLDITISDLRPNTPDMQERVTAALADVIREYATPPQVRLDPPRPDIPAGEIPVSVLWQTVAAVTGERVHKVVSPAEHVQTSPGSIRTLGQVFFI